MESSSFPMEKSEYNSVFKVFDKEGTGKIQIGQVMDLITNLEDSANEASKTSTKQNSLKDGSNTLAPLK